MNEEGRKLWIERIEDYRSSGLTAAKWADNKGIAIHKLRYYINKFNNENKQEPNQEDKELQWASIVTEATIVEFKSTDPLRVIIGKATIEVTPEFDKDTFESVIRILSQC